MKEEKDITPMDFEECFRKPDVLESSKVYWNESYCYISKSMRCTISLNIC